MSEVSRLLKSVLIMAGLAALAPALSAAQGPMPHRKAGMWDSTMAMGGRTLATTGMCIDESIDKPSSMLGPQQMGGARDCSGMTPQPIPGGLRMEGTCSNAGRTTHITATIKGDFSSAYAMDMVTEVDGKAQPSMHMDVKWTGPCGAGVKPGDMVMVMPNGQRMVMNAGALTAGARPGAGAPGR